MSLKSKLGMTPVMYSIFKVRVKRISLVGFFICQQICYLFIVAENRVLGHYLSDISNLPDVCPW